ncbi:3-deoxy-manno-octulosonate cytidylyltransferase [Pseudomonas urmiensis]|uniref:3-deoxy-manno-octulosonate cytidylyltransferase n=1 Tax=Pseudomonas urmiensis TaxID=2745493 RepID=UPI003D11BC63
MKTVVLIPARYKSSRFPGKPLVPLLGKPMILWVAELSGKAVGNENVYIATDDNRIAAVVTQAGFKAVMTSEEALTGTDRIAEAAELIDADIYINVQGDEPLVSPEDILRVAEYKRMNIDSVVNSYCHISKVENPYSTNIPKVIFTEDRRLVYMSRCALPGYKEASKAPAIYYKQVCIYGFTKEQLKQFREYGRKSILESSEDIEILRFLELGIEIRMIEAHDGSLAVDVPEDVAPVERALLKAGAL